MPVTATLLGSASGSGVDLAIPITVAQPAGTLVQVFTVAYTGPEAFFESQGYRSVPTDTEAGVWSFHTPHPFVDNTGDGFGGAGARVFGNIGSATRVSGTALAAGGGGSGPVPRTGCKDCGQELLGLLMRPSTGPGDTVTVHFFNTNGVDPSPTLGFVVAFSGVLDHFETSNRSQYGNGNTYPTNGSSSSVLNWLVDQGPGFVPTAAANCAGITLASAYGTNGWTPTNGATVASVSSGAAYLALSLDPAVVGGVTWEPGGSFAGAGSILLGNYQFIRVP